jgi:DNA mismatch repair ATPase MutS
MPKTPQNINDYYTNQLADYLALLDAAKKRIRQTAIFRISVFILTVISIYFATNMGMGWVIGCGLIGFGIFIGLALKHAKLFKEKRWFETLVEINRKELKLLEGNTAGQTEGSAYIDVEHPFTFNLDIFGKRSLFQLIDRSATDGGRAALAELLQNPINNEQELLLRQQAIAELKDKPEWRQHFQATGLLSEENKNAVDEIQNWMGGTSLSFNTLFYKVMLVLNPLIGFTIVVLISLGIVNYTTFLLFLVLPFVLVGTKISGINKEHHLLSKKAEQFQKYARLFRFIENEKLNSKLLTKAKNQLSGETHSANQGIHQLSKITSAFDYRLNMIVGLFLNAFFLWDILQLIRLENWKKMNSQYVESWFSVLFLFDEISSFSGFAFNHPNAVFPTFSNDFEINAIDVKHPFIAPKNNIGNNISVTGWSQFNIVTGANMAGKSTYLRTVGINLIMAMTGMPVLAKSFVFQPVKVFTGIKTSDSLQDGESYFFAELKRLKALIDLLEEGNKIFIILDEILRGTNSADKQKGSLGLIRQFIRLGASGMIATHDLGLGELINSYPQNIKNKRFEVEIESNELVFDYKLKEGISQNLNATFLMKKMGITLED